MYRFLFLFLILACTVSADGGLLGDTSSRMPVKPQVIHPQLVPDPVRQGGDTILDAVVVTLPVVEMTGTTLGYQNDYDEVCPYIDSTSPDVVYAFTPAADVELDIDLLGSTYDTKLYVYDADQNLVACNDDFYPDYVSRLEAVAVAAGTQYYVIIDGYGGDAGDYVLNIREYEPCVLELPAGGFPEGEPPLVDNYLDAHNGGCNSPEFDIPFQELSGDGQGELILCGVGGWYQFDGVNNRDTDWFHLHAGPNGVVEVMAESEEPILMVEGGPHDCGTPAVVQMIEVGDCEPTPMTISSCSPGGLIWFIVVPCSYSPPSPDGDHEFDYVITFTGLMTTVAIEPVNWSAVKSLFR